MANRNVCIMMIKDDGGNDVPHLVISYEALAEIFFQESSVMAAQDVPGLLALFELLARHSKSATRARQQWRKHVALDEEALEESDYDN